MFGNRVAQIKFVKENKKMVVDENGPFITPDPMLGPEVVAAYSAIAKDFITHATVVIGGGFCIFQIVKRVCK